MVSMVMCEFRMKSKEILKSSMAASMENTIDRIEKRAGYVGYVCYATINNQHNLISLIHC
jgi:hypothetical protein